MTTIWDLKAAVRREVLNGLDDWSTVYEAAAMMLVLQKEMAPMFDQNDLHTAAELLKELPYQLPGHMSRSIHITLVRNAEMLRRELLALATERA